MNQVYGQFFLNLAFVLYLTLYLPQLYHNHIHKTFAHMSLMMHIMLFQAYSCDLVYALKHHMPWQYLSVSSFGLLCLGIQHLQWMSFEKSYAKFLSLALVCLVWPFLVSYHLAAWCARILFLLHFLPQIIKYQQKNIEADAISLGYLGLSISLNFCDLLSAWFLHWESANLWGSFWSLSLKSYLLLLSLRFKPKLSFLKMRSAR